MTPCLPCVVCGRELENVFPDGANQPSDGLSFTTHGAYGTTLFDPMDGSTLELNICDNCVAQAARDGSVLWRQAERLVTCDGLVVGRLYLRDSEYVKWDPDARNPDDDTFVDVALDDVGTDLPDVSWRPDWRHLKGQLTLARSASQRENDA